MDQPRMYHSKVVYIVVIGQVALTIICVLALCLTLFYKNYSDPVVITALIAITGTLIGNLGSILGGPMRQMQGKAEVIVANSAEAPVQTEEVKT